MLRFCYLGIVFLAAFSFNLAKEYEGDDTNAPASVDASVHLIPNSKPLQFIDSSSASVGHFSIVDVLKPSHSTPVTPLIQSIGVEKPVPKALTNSSCLTLVLADNLKEHITPDNLQPVTVLLQHSLETCPGLKSTFEILQKMMDIKGMSIDEAINFIQKLTISSQGDEGAVAESPVEEEGENAVVENENVSVHDHHTENAPEFVNNSETDVSVPDSMNEEAAPEHVKIPEIHETEKEEVEPSEETNVEPTEEDNTNPMDVIQSVLSIFEENPELSSLLSEEGEEADDESVDEAPLESLPHLDSDNVEMNCNGWGCFKHRAV